MFIAVEGIDGCGKTEFSKKLAEELSEDNKKTIVTSEPTNSAYGKKAREILRNNPQIPAEIQKLPELFASDRKIHLKEIREYLRNGVTVICDRYVLSNIAYQSLDFPAEYIAGLNKNILVPDKTFFLDVKIETAMSRINNRGKNRDIYENPELLRKIYGNYMAAMEKYGELCGEICIVKND